MYSLLTFLLSFVLAPIFSLHSRGRIRLAERFGAWGIKEKEGIIWFHAASFGEVAGVLPVIEALKQSSRDKILVTATSPTGLDVAEGKVDYLRLIPFDSPVWIGRALRDLNLSCCIIAETEIWPGMLKVLCARSIPFSFINARISKHTISWYKAFVFLFRKQLLSAHSILCADTNSKQHFLELGVPESLLKVVGNSKYDKKKGVSSEAEARQLKSQFFKDDRPVFTLGSIRPGEEMVWFPAIRKAIDAGAQLSVVVAPRHKEKFDYFALQLEKYDLQYQRRSAQGAPSDSVLLIDRMGELEKIYSFSSLAFVGGSIVDFGGHNPLEAAAYGVPVVMGQYRGAVEELCDELERCGGLLSVSTEAQAFALLERLNFEQEALKEIGEKGRGVWQAAQGAVQRIVAALHKLEDSKESYTPCEII